MKKWIITILLINPITAMWLVFYVGSFLDLTNWYGFPYFMTSILFVFGTGFFDYYIADENL